MNTIEKLEYLTELLTELNQPFMVFMNKIIVLPTSSPMFETLPQSKLSNSNFGRLVKINDELDNDPSNYEFGEVEYYTFLLIDLVTYEIDKEWDTVENITHVTSHPPFA